MQWFVTFFLEYIDKLLRDFTREIDIFINLFLMSKKSSKSLGFN